MTIRVDRGSLSEPPNDLGTNQGSFSVRWAVGPNFQREFSDTPRPIKNAPVDPATGQPIPQTNGELGKNTLEPEVEEEKSEAPATPSGGEI